MSDPSRPPPPPLPYPNLATLHGRTLVDELARSGLRDAVVAPGSRSAPLAFALAAHPDVADRSAIDERAAAFAALGLARATGRPVAVVTTSGTAAANLHPAVAEADRDGVPLLVLTADRPPSLRDAGDSQAGDQVKLFGAAVRWFHEVGEPAGGDGLADRLAALRSTACHAWARALGAGGTPGPVHLNLAYSKPLAPVAGEDDPLGELAPEHPAVAGRPGGRPWRAVDAGRRAPADAAVERLARALAGARRPLVLAGAGGGWPGGRRLRAPLARLLARLPVPVWAEATSGLRLDPARPDGVVGAASLLLASDRFVERARPDLVVRLGRAPLDWPLRRFAALLAEEARAGELEQVTVTADGRRSDPAHAPGWTIEADPALLLDRLADALAGEIALEPDWPDLHRRAAAAAEASLAEAVDGVGELFDGGVLHRLGRRLPEDAALVVSSSMPMRELETFLPASAEDVDVFANRGLNGIDGVTATALGVAAGRRAAGESRTWLVTGDVALAHDLSGLAEAGRWGEDLTIVAIDNGGGAIFDHLPGAGTEPGFGRHFTTPPAVDWPAVAAGLGVEPVVPADWEAFEAAVAGRPGRPRLIQVKTDREAARRLRHQVAIEVARAVDGAVAGDRGKAARPGPGSEGAGPSGTARDRALHPTARAALADARPAAASEGPARRRQEHLRSPPPRTPAPDELTAVVEATDLGAPDGGSDGSGRRSDADRGGRSSDGRSRRGGLASDSDEPPALVLLHGFTGHPDAWEDFLAHLPEVRALPLALPGHAGEPVPEGLGFEAAVRGVLERIDRAELGDRRPWLLGYSMGGRLALAAALEAPERFAGLVLVGSSPGIEDAAEREERAAADDRRAEELEAEGLAAFVDRWMALDLFASQARRGHRFLRRARARRLGGSARGLAAALRGLSTGRQPSFWDRLGGLDLPVLLVVGEEDGKYREIARRMTKRLPRARVAVVPGTGHAPHEEDPAAVAARVRELLGGG